MLFLVCHFNFKQLPKAFPKPVWKTKMLYKCPISWGSIVFITSHPTRYIHLLRLHCTLNSNCFGRCCSEQKCRQQIQTKEFEELYEEENLKDILERRQLSALHFATSTHGDTQRTKEDRHIRPKILAEARHRVIITRTGHPHIRRTFSVVIVKYDFYLDFTNIIPSLNYGILLDSLQIWMLYWGYTNTSKWAQESKSVEYLMTETWSRAHAGAEFCLHNFHNFFKVTLMS